MSILDRIRGHHRERGQALVEFTLSIVVFLVLLMAVFDFGRIVYMYNGVNQAAREIARATSVHPGATLGSSAETAQVFATQRGMIPELRSPTFDCVDIDGSAVTDACLPGLWVKVSITAPATPISPILSWLGPFPLSSSSAAEIQ